MNNIRNIVFDFDGTLMDTAPLILGTMKATIENLGLESHTDEEYRATIGLRLEEIPAALWQATPEVGKLYAATYRRIFNELKQSFKVECFPGVIDTLKQLNADGCRMAIASSRSRKSLQEYVGLFGISDCFTMLVGGNDVAQGKPAPDPVLKILGSCGWKATETITVGDASVDMLMGRAAGTATCAVTYGNGTMEELLSSEPTFMIDTFNALRPIVRGVNPEIVKYVEHSIIPRYDDFDKAHRRDHVRMVIDQSLCFLRRLPELNIDMAYCIAAFHDLGLVDGRESHHIASGKILESDSFIRTYFTEQQIGIMKEAVEDHRASGKTKPRSLYGMVVADADRFIEAETIIRRTIQYGLANYPDLDRAGHHTRALQHLKVKYGPEGYLKVWLPWGENIERLQHLRTIIENPHLLDDLFSRIFDEEAKNGG